MAMGKRTSAKDRMPSRLHLETVALSVSIKRDLLEEFEDAASKLSLSPQQLMKYMMLTSLKHVKPDNETVAQWVRGK